MDRLQIILLEEGEFTDHNNDLMQSALQYWNNYLIDKNGELFLTVDSLITLNNIITDSKNLFLRDVNVKPAGFDKMYLDKSLNEPALFLLLDEFNERIVTHNQFCNIFLDFIHPFRDGNGKHVKLCLFKQHLIFNFYMKACKQFDNNWMIGWLSFFQVKMQFISTLKQTTLLCLINTFILLVIFLNKTNCIIKNRNILTDESNKWRKIERWRKNEM